MIVVYHTKGLHIDAITNVQGSQISVEMDTPFLSLFHLARKYPDQWICWCDQRIKKEVDFKKLADAAHHKCRMLSDLSLGSHFSDAIAYVEESPFVKANLETIYPTWQMSSMVGTVHARVLMQLEKQIPKNMELFQGLNLIAKCCQPQGLLCYHIPLQKSKIRNEIQQSGKRLNPYTFVARTFKRKWVVFLFFAQIIFENKWRVIGLIQGLFTKRLQLHFDAIKIQEDARGVSINDSIDVIIPTMGRENYLYDVLKDLASQIYLPQNVIIVEQNEDIHSSSALSYLTSERWPFAINHQFIHQTGACNARNIALGLTTAEWVFFADDDIRFQKDLFEKALIALRNSQGSCVAMSCLQKNEKKTFNNRMQWSSFPSGASMVKGTLSRKLSFNTSYEHGYGEDADYGMQLRNAGADVLYHPDLELVHLKAPVGGFRHRIIHPWESEGIQPKPSPTVMLYRLAHTTPTQVKGYKLRLFLRMVYQKKPVHLGRFIKEFKQAWDHSIRWAKILEDR